MTPPNRLIALLVMCAAVLVLTASAADQEQPARRPAPPLDRLLFPPAIQGRLGLSDEQKSRVTRLAQEFVVKHRQELGSLAAEIDAALRGLRQARQREDRQAFGEAQGQIRDLLNKVAGLRTALEPALFKVLDEDQQQKYREFKPDFLRPAVMFGLLRGSGSDARDPQRPVGAEPLTPLPDLGTGSYHRFKGGLYPDGKNERPAAHEAAGRALAATIEALDETGKPGPKGKIVLLTVGMSNTEQATAGFMGAVSHDPDLNPQVVLVNGAQGGQTAARTQDPNDHASGTAFWNTVDERLHSAGLTPFQVQAAWVKQADAGPTEGFPEYAKILETELARIMRVLHQRFPNLKLVYLSSRTYGGYAKTGLNPEPYAYESGFSVKWLIERQLKGDLALNFDPAKGPVTAPWLSWGPYLWANGTAKRGDGFSYEEGDFRETDGTHESPAGQRKVGLALLNFFKSDSTTKGWFVKRGA